MLVVRLALVNIVLAYGFRLMLARDRREGDLKAVLLVAALTDYVLSHRPETTLTLATAVVLISPQELFCIFAPFTVVALFDSERGSHLLNPLLLLTAVSYWWLSQGFLVGITQLQPQEGMQATKLRGWANSFACASAVAIASILTSTVVNTRWAVMPVYYSATAALVAHVYYNLPIKIA